MTRDRTITKVLTTPWIKAKVTISPFETWLTSWAKTASTSSCVIERINPVLTATKALFLFIPVANALGSGAS